MVQRSVSNYMSYMRCLWLIFQFLEFISYLKIIAFMHAVVLPLSSSGLTGCSGDLQAGHGTTNP